MHPSYHADKPGTAPDCGMRLEPVYAVADRAKEGGGTFDAVEQNRLPVAETLAILNGMGVDPSQIEEIGRTRQPQLDTRLTAPAGGVILSRNVYPNQKFESGAELYRIADISRAWVVADLYSNEAQYVRPGAAVRISLSAYPQKTFTARVSDVPPQFDGVSRTLKLRMEIENPGFALRPDMIVDVEAPVTRVYERLKIALPLTLILIFFLLYANTRSLTKTLIVLLAVPFSAVGAVWFLYLAGYNMSVGVWVGLIALLGVDAETGVFMLLYLDLAYEQARRTGRLASLDELRDAILAGAVKRIRPKVMTVTAISVGLLPVMWSTGIGADTMKRIAAPMVGGVFSSFLMELLVYPAIYEIWKWNFELRPRLGRNRAPAVAEIYDAGEETIIPVEN